MKFAERMNALKPSATLAIGARAKAMRAEGIDVLAMSAGEPDFPPPESVRATAIDAIREGESKYTPVAGLPDLRSAIADDINRFYQTKFTGKNTMVSAGGKQVAFNLCATVLGPGDEAVLPLPYWVSYPDMVRFAGATPRAAASDKPYQTAHAIEQEITDKTRLVILNSPSNPGGAMIPREELAAIADVLRRYPDTWILSDDIYNRLVYEGTFVGLAHVAPDLLDRTLILAGVSKTYGMTGWRIGYGIGPEALIAKMSIIQGASTSGANCIAQRAAIEAIRGDQAPAEEMKRAFARRRTRIMELLNKIEGLETHMPEGAFYVFPNVSAFYNDTIKDSGALCEHLLDTVRLAVVPGHAFGAPNHVRISFACSDETIDEGIARFASGLQQI